MKIDLKVEQWQYIYALLRQQKYNDVAIIIEEIKKQTMQQIKNDTNNDINKGKDLDGTNKNKPKRKNTTK